MDVVNNLPVGAGIAAAFVLGWIFGAVCLRVYDAWTRRRSLNVKVRDAYVQRYRQQLLDSLEAGLARRRCAYDDARHDYAASGRQSENQRGN